MCAVCVWALCCVLTCVTMLIQKQRRCNSDLTPPMLQPSHEPDMMATSLTPNTTSATHTLSAMADCGTQGTSSTQSVIV